MNNDAVSISIQVLALATNFLGTWMIGNKVARGHAVSRVSSACFIALNIYIGLWLVAAFGVVSFLIHTRNFRKWKHEDK